MRSYFTHKAYPCVVDKFNASFNEDKLNCDDYWYAFTDLQRKISKNKCPICEIELTDIPNKTNTATLDHFRPKAQEMYPFLRCVPENYILMCSLCNTTYKGDLFPLIDESKRATGSKNIDDTKEEEALLFNPTEKDPLYFFELSFIQTQQGGILELKRNSKTISKDKNDYEYKQCTEMIEMFGLGYCHKDTRTDTRKEYNSKTKKMEILLVKKCRVDILTDHYNTFIELAKARSDKKSLALFLKNKNRKNELKKYGFFRFIMKNQFSIK